ncbi:MAG: flavodoxin-dependent (E)-4-hydroxy-3-methylbut-2-enyl-diphosphate synthase [Eubacteriales bacterium]
MRRNSKKIRCGSLYIGGDAEISIQSMTNTDTRDVAATVSQIMRLKEAGCQIIRCAIVDFEAIEALKDIRRVVDMPIVADIHFDYRLAIEAIKNGADKIRINPGNIGDSDKVKKIIKLAKERSIPIRIGVNSGSLEKDILTQFGGVTAEGLVLSAMRNISMIEEMGFNDIVVSLKSSNVKLNYDAHQIIADKMNYPIHIGITEAGGLVSGKIKSSIGIGSLLLGGIGDTIRVSLTGDPVNEVIYAKEILRACEIRKDGINIIACPTCGRSNMDLDEILQEVEDIVKDIKSEKRINIAIMGCEVNGPGEAREADIGIACGKGKALLFKSGEIVKPLERDEIKKCLIEEIKSLLSDK